MTLPANEIAGRDLAELIPAEIRKDPDGDDYAQPHSWRLLDGRQVAMKNIGCTGRKRRHVGSE
jgi:hypothetical protein